MQQIQNNFLTVQIAEKGAEIQSVCSFEGLEYMWEADPTYWSKRSPILFPYIGRLTEGKYTFDGTTYEMTKHGFASTADFTVENVTSNRIRFTLDATEKYLEMYPFPCLFHVDYALDDNTLHITMSVENKGDRTMYFGFGGHPGFRVPLEADLQFEDYELRFPEGYEALKDEGSADCYRLNRQTQFPIEDNRLPLRHELFDDDAITLFNAPDFITLASHVGEHGLTLYTGGLPYLGLWQKPRTDAPYICIEPWSSLPSRQGIIEDLATQENLLHLDVGGMHTQTWSVRFF